MFARLRKVLRPNAHGRRILSGICAAFVLATIAFSSIFVSSDADHDCHGHNCPVCQEMQACIANFQLMGSSLDGTTAISTPTVSFRSDACLACAYHAPALTLQRLDVRFDE